MNMNERATVHTRFLMAVRWSMGMCIHRTALVREAYSSYWERAANTRNINQAASRTMIGSCLLVLLLAPEREDSYVHARLRRRS